LRHPPPRGGRAGGRARRGHGPRPRGRRRHRHRDQLPRRGPGDHPARGRPGTDRGASRRPHSRGGRGRREPRAGPLLGLRPGARRAVHLGAGRRRPRGPGLRARPRGGLPQHHRPHRRGGAVSTAAGSTPTSSPATTLSSARPRTSAAPSAATRTVRYALHTTRMTVTNVMFMIFTIAMPVGMYLLFGMMFGEQGGGDARGIIMVNMAAYGGLGAAVTAGTQIQEDQRNGFLRQLIVAGLSPRSFLVGSVMAASAVIVPALVAVGLVGLATGVELAPARFLATIGVLWLGLLPTILIGIVLGTVLKGGAAMA